MSKYSLMFLYTILSVLYAYGLTIYSESKFYTLYLHWSIFLYCLVLYISLYHIVMYF